MVKPSGCSLLLILSLISSARLVFGEDRGNPADEIVKLINQNRTASKLPKLFDSQGLGCMALQYVSKCMWDCSSNNTLKCDPPEVDITEVFAPNCGVELPTVETISGKIVGCHWQYLNPEEAFSEILISDKKALSVLHSKNHTEVGIAVRRVKKGASFWCILLSSGTTNTSFVLEGGRGIEQKTGCFSGADQTCSAGRKLLFMDALLPLGLVFLLHALALVVQV